MQCSDAVMFVTDRGGHGAGSECLGLYKKQDGREVVSFDPHFAKSHPSFTLISLAIGNYNHLLENKRRDWKDGQSLYGQQKPFDFHD